MDKRRIAVVIIVFLLVTAPGAFDSWLSIIDRYTPGNESTVVTFNPTLSFFQIGFPVVGLALLLWGLWWTKPKVTVEAEVPSVTNSGSVSV